VVEDLHERLAKVETKVERHEKKFDTQMEKNDLLTRVIVLQEQQQEINKDHVKQMDKFDKTLNRIDKNLDGLNKNLELLDNRVGKLEESENGSKISVPNMMTKIVIGLFMAIPTIITTWILIQLNLK
jgi:chromosome segregation ATPase